MLCFSSALSLATVPNQGNYKKKERGFSQARFPKVYSIRETCSVNSSISNKKIRKKLDKILVLFGVKFVS